MYRTISKRGRSTFFGQTATSWVSGPINIQCEFGTHTLAKAYPTGVLTVFYVRRTLHDTFTERTTIF
jgi:hypothetical protein